MPPADGRVPRCTDHVHCRARPRCWAARPGLSWGRTGGGSHNYYVINCLAFPLQGNCLQSFVQQMGGLTQPALNSCAHPTNCLGMPIMEGRGRMDGNGCRWQVPTGDAGSGGRSCSHGTGKQWRPELLCSQTGTYRSIAQNLSSDAMLFWCRLFCL